MGFIEKILKRPYLIYSFLTLFIFLGIVGYQKVDRKLFPDSNYPTIAVVVLNPGSSAKNIAANVSVPIEEELYTIDKVRRVFSSTIDEVSVIQAEFEYDKNIENAASDVKNSIDKIRSKLPSSIKEPQIHKITSATAPIITIAMSSDKISLGDIRQLAQNKIKHKLIKLEGVANVDVFGGYEKEVQIIVDKKKLDSYNIPMAVVIGTLKKSDDDFAIGFITSGHDKYLLKSKGERESIKALKSLHITPDVILSDIAKVSFDYYDNSAVYYGNSKKSIALAVQRGIDSDVIKTIESVEGYLKKLKTQYPEINFEITDTQKTTIVQSTQNMFESLRDAIIMSTIVVFLFLASFRQVLVVLVTIPIVYATTIALMWLVGIEFNVVTLTAIILALGLLLDDTVVVMENIERHYKELHDKIDKAVLGGTKEIMFADLSGTLTTMIALSPMLFVGGYPQTVFQPLVGTLLLALAASYVVSITAVPLLSMKILTINNPFVLKSEEYFHKISGRVNDFIANFFRSVLLLALNSRAIAITYGVVLLLLFLSSVKVVMPLVGQELMPPMDTGALKIAITVEPNLPIEDSEEILKKVDKIISAEAKLLTLSSTLGSEAGVMSMGSGSGIDHISITATYEDRFQRDKDIWEIERALREKLTHIKNIKSVDVVDFGATALASLRANIDVTLSSDNFKDLEVAAGMVEKAMYKTQGVVSVSKTWHSDKSVYDLSVDDKMAQFYSLNREDIVAQLQAYLRGAKVAKFALQNSTSLNVRVWVAQTQRDTKEVLENILLNTPKGSIPLNMVAKIVKIKEPSIITREGLNYTINVYGFRQKAAISHIMANFEEAFSGTKLPKSVSMEQTGDIKQFKNSASRMAKAIAFAIMFILLTLVVLFNSLKISLMIIVSIPLTIIGASWGMLLAGYHTSMPAMMGFILLSGIIVNNAILLIHFAMEKMQLGMDKKEAMLESIKIRTRPVLMTACAVSVGMLPVAQGAAIGLERLAPLGTVAIGGLIVGTLLTLVFIPMVFIWSVKDVDTKGV